MKVEFARLAKEQFRLAQAGYRAESLARSKRFAAQVRRVVTLLSEYPEAGRRFHGFRRIVVQRFPYSLLYVVESERVFILELVYQKQEPAYWTDDEG